MTVIFAVAQREGIPDTKTQQTKPTPKNTHNKNQKGFSKKNCSVSRTSSRHCRSINPNVLNELRKKMTTCQKPEETNQNPKHKQNQNTHKNQHQGSHQVKRTWDVARMFSSLFLTLRFFLLAAAWVDPGRSALQSAEQWRKGRYGRMHQVGKMSFYDKNMQKGR